MATAYFLVHCALLTIAGSASRRSRLDVAYRTQSRSPTIPTTKMPLQLCRTGAVREKRALDSRRLILEPHRVPGLVLLPGPGKSYNKKRGDAQAERGAYVSCSPTQRFFTKKQDRPPKANRPDLPSSA